MKKQSQIGKWVLAGANTHYEFQGQLLCGCTDKVQGDAKPLGDQVESVKFLLPICSRCKGLNTDRWAGMGEPSR